MVWLTAGGFGVIQQALYTEHCLGMSLRCLDVPHNSSTSDIQWLHGRNMAISEECGEGSIS